LHLHIYSIIICVTGDGVGQDG